MNNNFSNICFSQSEESRNTTHSSGKPATNVGCEVVQHAHTLSKMLYNIRPSHYKKSKLYLFSPTKPTNQNLDVQSAHTLTTFLTTPPSGRTGWIVYGPLNPFSPDDTLECRFEKFLIFIWKGVIFVAHTYERRDYEALAGWGTFIVEQTQKSTKKTITVAKGLSNMFFCHQFLSTNLLVQL